MAEITRDEIADIIKANVKADATGLAPAIIGHVMFGFNEAADAILARLGDEWKSAKDQPPPGIHVWCYERALNCYYEAWIENHVQYGPIWMDFADSEPEPTHWRPLPSPPKESA